MTRHLCICCSLSLTCLSVEVPKNVKDFGTELTRAVVTNNTLELANDTRFVGLPLMGSKLFIRSCYKELSTIIFDGASDGSMKNIVVTGTPGIGKSLFGYYLLYLLRCQGKTVVFQNKQDWYRFSDAGVVKGRFDTFQDTGYLTNDSNDWYLSDPEGKPYEGFVGITVVLVSPKQNRVNEFLKQVQSRRFFMPVWSEDELLECQRVVFRHAQSVDVRKAFEKVGGVARAVFDPELFDLLVGKMERATSKVNLALLQQVCSVKQNELLSTDSTGDALFHDALFHMLPSPGTTYKYFNVVFASEYALELVEKAIPEREYLAFQGHVMATLEHTDLNSKVGGSARGQMFERLAQVALTSSVRSKKTTEFNMTILSNSGKDVLGDGELSLNFTRIKEFEGNAFPQTRLLSGTYYRPKSQTFAAVDSFCVDRSSGTLYFFQMKSAGVEVIGTGASVEEYWKNASSKSKSITKCVLVYVVPRGIKWQKAINLGEDDDWLEGATVDFKSACGVCAIHLESHLYS